MSLKGYLIYGKKTAIMGGIGYSDLKKSIDDAIQKASDYDKLLNSKKSFMKVKEWLDYKKIEKVIDNKWNYKNDNKDSMTTNSSTHLFYSD